ncbi:MAG: FHA domain-containing protein [Gemmataceae bacterium]
MTHKVLGELVPVGGGDPIPLIRDDMTIGRLESCDVCLRLPNVSKTHCRLMYNNGWWYIQDAGSTNGTKVNGARITTRTMLHPGHEITLAKRTWTIEYEAPEGGFEEVESEDDMENILEQSLLEKAGLAKPKEKKDR